MSDEKKYLTELGRQLDDYAAQIQGLSSDEENHEVVRAKLLETLKAEEILREKCGIGARFNVIRTQLQSVLNEFEKKMSLTKEEIVAPLLTVEELTNNQAKVYVYLFNSQGSILKSWQKLLTENALIEHSVNRPIYANQNQIETMIRAKPNKAQHAYVSIIINNEDVLESAQRSTLQDQHGYPLLRLKQGALKSKNIKNFFHDSTFYEISPSGDILIASSENEEE